MLFHLGKLSSKVKDKKMEKQGNIMLFYQYLDSQETAKEHPTISSNPPSP